MVSIGIIGALAGVSTFLGLIAVLGFFVYKSQARAASKPVEQLIKDSGIVKAETLAQIPENDRLAALRALLQAEHRKDEQLFQKIEDKIDVAKIEKDRAEGKLRQLRVVAISLFAIAFLGLVYAVLSRDNYPGPKDPCLDEDPPAECILKE
jgi:hypothetical protein